MEKKVSQAANLDWTHSSLLFLKGEMILTVSLMSPRISAPAPAWLQSASSLWPRTVQRPLEEVSFGITEPGLYGFIFF